MDGRDFDDMMRTLTTLRSRRGLVRVVGGTLAALGVPGLTHLGADDAAAKKKKCRGNKKKCGKTCIPKANCCTSNDCAAGELCTNGQCVCTPDCTGKECGDDGCGGDCGDCEGNDQCNAAGQCVPCTPDCNGKACGNDGCGGSCGTCENGTCQGGQCLCPFATGCNPLDAGECATCSTGVCCPNGEACLSGQCSACPETPDACTVEHVCGLTTAEMSPFCYCVSSVDDVTTCTSVFVNQFQSFSCTADAQCADLLGPGVDMVCVNAPCLGLGIQGVCMNEGCVDLAPGRTRSHAAGDATAIVQLDFRSRS